MADCRVAGRMSVSESSFRIHQSAFRVSQCPPFSSSSATYFSYAAAAIRSFISPRSLGSTLISHALP